MVIETIIKILENSAVQSFIVCAGTGIMIYYIFKGIGILLRKVNIQINIYEKDEVEKNDD